MAKNITLWVILACVIALLVGGIIGYKLMPTKVETKEVVKEVQIPVTTEVVKEVPLDVKGTYLDPAVKDFIKKASKSDDFIFCDEQQYDEDQIKLKSDPRDYKVEISQDQTIISFDARVKYLDKDVQEKCYSEYNVAVTYEDGEKPQVEFSLI